MQWHRDRRHVHSEFPDKKSYKTKRHAERLLISARFIFF